MAANKKKRNRVVGAFLILGIAGLFIVKIVEAIQSNFSALDEQLTSVYYITSEDSDLIASKYLPLLKVDAVMRTKVRNDFSVLSINNVRVVIYKIDEKIDNTLKSIIHTEIRNVNRSTGVSYGFVPFYDRSYQFKAGGINNVSSIYLTMFGKDITNIKTSDSVLAYSLLSENISLRYGVDSTIDIYIESVNRIFDKPKLIQIMFLKRNSSIYFITLTAKKEEIMGGNMILNIIKQ